MSQLIRNVLSSGLGLRRRWTINDEDSGDPVLEFDAFLALA